MGPNVGPPGTSILSAAGYAGTTKGSIAGEGTQLGGQPQTNSRNLPSCAIGAAAQAPAPALPPSPWEAARPALAKQRVAAQAAPDFIPPF